MLIICLFVCLFSGSDGTLRIWNISNWQKNNAQPTLIKHLFNKSSESVCCLDWNVGRQ